MSDNNSPLLRLEDDFKAHGLFFTVTFRGFNTFHSNKNFTVYAVGTKLLFKGADIRFTNNTLSVNDVQGTPIYTRNSTIIFENSKVAFSQNQGLPCGGIAVDRSQVLFKDNVTVNFANNRGLTGGALSLYTGSTIVLNATESNVTLSFISNTARLGGAIYVEDGGYNEVRSVFHLQGETTLVKLWFRNNSALLGGNNIYGGWVDWFDNGVTDILQVSWDNNSTVASDPVRICLCNDHLIPDCTITNYTMDIYGCALNLDMVAVGQRFTPVTAYVEAVARPESELQVTPRIERLQMTCTRVKYKVHSHNDEEILVLKPYLGYTMSSNISDTSQLLFLQLTIRLKKHECSLGFFQKKHNCECVCQSSITSNGLSCDMNNYSIKRSRQQQQWVGVTREHTTTGEYSGVIAHQHCPFDYCKTNETLSLRLEDQDEQCAFNRTGILCGGCKTNFSRVLGSSKCKECSNLMLLAIIPSGLLAGLVLITVLMILNLTVSVGTINGLIFYANIIQAQHASFFIPDTSNLFLSKFIALLNLDLGTESCLYNGLDSYVEIWLQFCFPLYIWLLVTAIIFSSHYSTRISKLSSKNTVQVLATLFLLSYTKLLRLVVDVVSFTTITYPDGYVKAVWFYDGNIDYLRGKHIPLFIATLLLIVLLSVPYTLSLVSIQLLYKISHYNAMFWVQKLKPLFDAYTGPYRANRRYWTGLLLLIRIVLLVVFSVNQNNNATVSLLCITVVSFILLAWLQFSGWVYEGLLNNCLEFIFLLNLGLTSIAILIYKQPHPVVIYSSTGIAFVLFVGIILYHAQRQLFLTRAGAKLRKNLSQILHRKSDEDVESIQLHSGKCKAEESSKQVTYSVVDLTQPLLEREEEEKDKTKEL